MRMRASAVDDIITPYAARDVMPYCRGALSAYADAVIFIAAYAYFAATILCR